MPKLNTRRILLDTPKTSLTVLWLVWKIVLLIIAVTSPGSGYDTSTTLDLGHTSVVQQDTATRWSYLYALNRWDAIYFNRIAKRGYVYEQEWAFSWGFTRLVGIIFKGLILVGFSETFNNQIISGILLAHVSHLLSILMLYQLSRDVFPMRHSSDATKFAFVTAGLHIISPAGLFLSAPYSESLFALLSFSGFYYYAKSLRVGNHDSLVAKNLNIVISGLLLGFATSVRGNGLLNGLIFVYDIAVCAPSFLWSGDRSAPLYRIVAAACGGVLVACGFLVPQCLAYHEFCVVANLTGNVRPWCLGWFPSIYAWVQSYYWGSGFFKYWTVSNIPLFILAMPMLYIMASSAVGGLKGTTFRSSRQPAKGTDQTEDIEYNLIPDTTRSVIQALSLSQFALTMLALSSYHVQIITRLSSGYPVWYWWLASRILKPRLSSKSGEALVGAQSVVQWMVLYAVIQGGLFASFLPPA